VGSWRVGIEPETGNKTGVSVGLKAWGMLKDGLVQGVGSSSRSYGLWSMCW
jgi:hypothetical protein